jgi:hypothetical protein
VSATKARVLEALGKLQRKPVDVPILGGQVWVRPLTVAGMGRIHALMATPNDRHKAASVALAKDPTNPELLKAEADALAAVENAKQRTSTVMLLPPCRSAWRSSCSPPSSRRATSPTTRPENSRETE